MDIYKAILLKSLLKSTWNLQPHISIETHKQDLRKKQ